VFSSNAKLVFEIVGLWFEGGGGGVDPPPTGAEEELLPPPPPQDVNVAAIKTGNILAIRCVKIVTLKPDPFETLFKT
jgi:hypothetical protein